MQLFPFYIEIVHRYFASTTPDKSLKYPLFLPSQHLFISFIPSIYISTVFRSFHPSSMGIFSFELLKYFSTTPPPPLPPSTLHNSTLQHDIRPSAYFIIHQSIGNSYFTPSSFPFPGPFAHPSLSILLLFSPFPLPFTFPLFPYHVNPLIKFQDLHTREK